MTLATGLCLCGSAALAGAAVAVAGARDALVLLLLLIPLGLLLLWQWLWDTLGLQEWQVGPDWLELRQTLGSYCRTRRYQGMRLEVSYWTYDLPGMDTDHAEGWGLYVIEPEGRHFLWSPDARSSREKADLRAIGEFLSSQTGWPLVIRKLTDRD